MPQSRSRRTTAAAWTNLGTARLRLGRVDDAVAAYRRAQALDPASLAAHVNLGNALEQAGDVDAAVASLEAALELDPEAHEVLNNLGNLYKTQGRADDAIAAYEAARRAAPAFRPAWSNLLAATKLSFHRTPEEIYGLHRAFAARFEWDWQAGYVPAANPPDPDRRLRIGYVSPDCHTALPAFVEPVLRAHDRARFEVFAYFNNPQPQATLDRLGAVAARVMKGAPDATVAQWIRDDGIDILIDIAGHTGHNRLGVFGRKPAPVQVTWLDYLNTTGLDAIDYRITDAVSDPPGATEAHSSETLIRVAPAQWCWKPARHGDGSVAAADGRDRSPDARLVQQWREAHRRDARALVVRARGGPFGDSRRRRRPRRAGAGAHPRSAGPRAPRAHRGARHAGRVPPRNRCRRHRARSATVLRRHDDPRDALAGRARRDLARRDAAVAVDRKRALDARTRRLDRT